MISIYICSFDSRQNMHQWVVKPCNVSLTMIRRHPHWVRGKKKINTKSTFLSRFWSALGLEYLSLSRDSWVCSLQGQIGSEHLGFLVQTSKVKLAPAALVITLSLSVSLSGSGRALTLLMNEDYLDTQSKLKVALRLIHILFYLTWCNALVSEFFFLFARFGYGKISGQWWWGIKKASIILG